MAEQPIASQLLCTQCGGELHPDQGQIFETCPFCGSTVYLDKSKVVFHWYLAPTLDEPRAQASLRRWMSGNDTVKDLDQKAAVLGHRFAYFPTWFFRRKTGDGKETLYLQPAAATSISEVKNLRIPAGDLRQYDHALDPQAELPTVPLAAAQKWVVSRGVNENEIAETALVHLPVYYYRYRFGGRDYTALVEAGTGRVLANIFPEKAEAPYALAAGLTIGGYLLLALVPLAAALIVGDLLEGFFGGLGVCVGLGIPFGVLCFIVAAWVAAKV